MELFITATGLLMVAGAAVNARIVIPAEQVLHPSADHRLLLKDAIDIHAHLDSALEHADPAGNRSWMSWYPLCERFEVDHA